MKSSNYLVCVVSEILGSVQEHQTPDRPHWLDNLWKGNKIYYSYVPSFPQHVDIMRSIYELQASDFVELEEVSRRFYKVKGLHFLS